MQTKHRLDAPLRIKSVTESGEFSGYGSIFGVEDSYGDVVVKGAFENTLSKWRGKNAWPAMLWQHDTREPVGVYTKMEEDDEGLYLEGRLLIDDDQLAKRAHGHLKAGSISGLSIGYSLPGGYEYDKEKGVFILSEIDLWEVSLVTFPANDEARVQQVKRVLGEGLTPKPKHVERLLRDAGFSRRQATAFMADGYKGMTLRDAENDPECVTEIKNMILNLKGK